MDGVQMYEEVIASLGLPEEIARSWFIQKLEEKNLKAEDLNLESLRDLASEMILDLILDPSFSP